MPAKCRQPQFVNIFATTFLLILLESTIFRRKRAKVYDVRAAFHDMGASFAQYCFSFIYTGLSASRSISFLLEANTPCQRRRRRVALARLFLCRASRYLFPFIAMRPPLSSAGHRSASSYHFSFLVIIDFSKYFYLS